MRRVLCRAMNGVIGDHPLGLIIVIATGIEITNKAWEIAAGNLQTNSMPLQKDVTGGVQVDPKFLDAACLHEDLLVKALPLVVPKKGILNIEGTAIGVHIHQFNGKIGVSG